MLFDDSAVRMRRGAAEAHGWLSEQWPGWTSECGRKRNGGFGGVRCGNSDVAIAAAFDPSRKLGMSG